ncbi:RNA polymerase sigma-54 factor [Halioglobus japonicus]|uniref:RNA polymerase sigma-54 factor n=1 Tax=Halioglobus japonicus TaxID=930805 RepID=A0AAP8SP34_9GAMM|nr:MULTISPECIES: RNA polymerase factor sigma-54 [Halioglobus]KZX59528.1 RNA polymerase factor sigma-54 [Halioglobus sp. HI00S01]PLW87119.1 RNA polymerase factor sigma-54 [Halioglobus japonicus]GHD10103.1 RNA polymerase sigma-54 factor [Halioglobus japonicus]
MKQSLQLKLGQQLTMTPQLQQAIRLLQLSTVDLQQEIQQALDNNPLLEAGEDEPGPVDSPPDTDSTPSHDGPLENLEQTATAGENTPQDTASATLPDDLPVDTQWEDLLPSGSAPPPPPEDVPGSDFETRGGARQSLQEHLLWQLGLSRLSDTDRVIALAIIDATDDNGRLMLSVEDIHQSLQGHELEIDEDEVVAVLHMLQQFEPAGVCTRDLQECLLVQLQQLPADTPYLEQARQILNRHLGQLASGDFSQIMRRTRLKEEQLKDVLGLIQTLDPNPGETFAPSEVEYVVPDVFVSKKDGRWLVELNPDIAPRLRINAEYASLIKRADNSADNTYLKDNLQEARWFLKSLQSRNETLMKVATKIVEHQRNFLEYGEEAMKPLVLHDIAEAVEMHESTISRVTTQKYMHTPRGIFELKYFFSSHVATTAGGECSSTAIRALIKKLVAAENPRKPLSDNKITQLLEEQGIKVARRTIAKYRDTLLIPPSNERKRLV